MDMRVDSNIEHRNDMAMAEKRNMRRRVMRGMFVDSRFVDSRFVDFVMSGWWTVIGDFRHQTTVH